MKGEKELEGDPPLLGGSQEGARADAVVQAVLHELPHEEAGPVGKLEHFKHATFLEVHGHFYFKEYLAL